MASSPWWRAGRTVAGALLGVAVAAGVVAGSVWMVANEEELPALPAEAETALEAQPEPEDPDGWRRELGEPLDKPNLELTADDGQRDDLRAETAGTATLVLFGFAHCRDACPAQLAILASAVADLSVTEREGLEVVFVSVDPNRDTPARLRRWLAAYDEGFVGLTGDLAQVEDAMGQLLLSAPRPEDADADGDYHVHHHSPFVAFHPADDRAHTMYPFGIRADQWRQELPRLIGGANLAE